MTTPYESPDADDPVVLVPAEESARAAARLFDVQAAALRWLLSDARVMAEVDHVGSTAVPGLEGKGDLDIQVTVPAEDFERACATVGRHYESHPGGFALPNGQSFKRDDLQPPLGVHVVRLGSDADMQRHIRDVLCARPDLVDELNALKRRFAGRPQREYREAKALFFEALLDGR